LWEEMEKPSTSRREKPAARVAAVFSLLGVLQVCCEHKLSQEA
jgi:hypothetical protein